MDRATVVRKLKGEPKMQAFRKNLTCQAVAIFVAALMMTGTTAPVRAASHREAPLIALDPAADNTDTYAFRS